MISEIIDDALSSLSPIREHYVKPGENLTTIAQQWYGDWRGWRDIYDANSAVIENVNLIFPGQVLAIPYRQHRAC